MCLQQVWPKRSDGHRPILGLAEQDMFEDWKQ